MKKYILLILALAVLCCVLCACSDGGNVTENDGSVVTDNANDNGDNGDKGDNDDNNLGDDIKDGVDDIGDNIGEGIDDITGSGSDSSSGNQQPSATAVPGTQAITP